MKKSKKPALAGIFTALCFVFLGLGSLFQVLDLSAAAFAGLIILVSIIELGKGWAFGIYLAASLISLILLPYKTPAIVFALFLGFYPIIKAPLNLIKPIWFSVIARLFCFNLFFTAMIFVSTKFFGITEDWLGFGVAIYLLCNAAFYIFDLALERFAAYYVSRLRSRIFPKG